MYLQLSTMQVYGNSIYDGFKSIACFETIELSAGRDTSRDKTIHKCLCSLPLWTIQV